MTVDEINREVNSSMLKTVRVQGFFHVTAEEINREVNSSMLKTVIVQGFFHVTAEEINKEVNSSMLKTIPGSRKIHHLWVLAENVLATRQLSCFCGSCMSEDFAKCLSAGYVEAWQTAMLRFSGPAPLPPPFQIRFPLLRLTLYWLMSA